MGTSYDKFLKKANIKAQRNRTNRVTRTAKKYGRGLGKSHKQYIAGDITSSASNRAYGYKMNGNAPINQFTNGQDPYLYKQQQEGYDPYEFKYVYTGKPTWVKGGTSARGNKYDGFWSRNRLATDKEKELYKKTGSLDFKQAEKDSKYSVMSSHKKDASTFKEQLNTPVWDGLNVAKQRVKNGKGKYEYLKGFLKDVVVDPVFDGLKTFDKYESALLGGLSGGIEESANLFEAIADPNIKIKDNVNFRRPFENFQSSMKESDKTGWGKSTGAFFDEASSRNFEKEKARIKNSTSYTKEHKKALLEDLEEKQNGEFHKLFRNVAGFGMDIANPINLGSSVMKTGKKLLGNSADALNDLRKGTADLSMGIMPKHIREANQKKAMKLANDNMFNPLKPKTGESVTDILQETKPMNDLKMYDDYKLDGVLKQGYKNAMNNDVDKVIKSNPATQNLGNFIDNLKPQKSPIVDDFENMFEASDVPNSRLGKDLFFKKIDNLPDRESDEVLDWLAEYNPKVYDEYLDGVDDLDEFADGLAKEQKVDDILDEKIENERNHRYFEGSQQNSLAPEIAKRYDAFNPSLSEQEKINKAYEKLQKYRMLNNKKPITSKIKTPSENMKTFVDRGREFIDDISKLDSNDLKELSNLMDSFTKVDDNLRRDEIVSHLNDLMFGGEKVLLNTIRPNDLEQLTTHLADLVDYKLAKANGLFSFKPRVPGDNAKDGIHYFAGRNGKENKFFDKFSMFSPASADELFNDKMSDLSSFFGVKNKSELTTPLKELKAKLRKGEDLTPDELVEYDRLSEAVNRWNDLYKNNIKNMDFDEYQKFRKEELGFKDGYEEYVEKHMKQYSDDDVNRKDFVKNIEDGRSPRNSDYNPLTKEGRKPKYEKANPYQANDFTDDMYKPKDAIEEGYIKAEKDEIAKKQRMFEELVDLHKELKIPLPKVKNANVKISSEQKLSKIPDVLHNRDGLKKVIENEMEMMYKNPTKYEKHKDTLKNMKKEFVNAMRSYGVKDEQYFKNVKALQDDLDLYYKELNKPTSIIKKSSEGGQGTPKLGMNLQLLAERINKRLDDLDVKDVKDVKKSSKSKEFVNGFDKFNQKGNLKNIDDTPVQISKPKVRKKKSQAQIDNINKTLERYSSANSLKEVTPKDNRLPRLSELINSGLSKDEAMDVLDKMKRGEIEIPSHTVTKKVNKQNGWVNTTTSTDFDDLKKVLSDSPETSEIAENIKPPSFEEFKKQYKDGNPHMKYEDSKIYDIYKRWLNTWKKGLTVYNPGWHIQNFFQNKGQNYLALGKDAFGSQKNAKNLLNYIQGEGNKVKDVIDKKNGIIYSGDDLKALVNRNKVINSQTNDIMKSRGVFSKLETKIDNSKRMKKLGHSEDTARLYHFIKQLERGMSPEDATKSVNKYLFDYDKKSKGDKIMSDFIDPFWVFHKNYAKLLGKTALENPSAINNILRSERSLENGVAESDKNSTATEWDKIQSPYGSFKDEKNGSIYDYLYKQNIMPRIQDAVPTDLDEVENKLNPILRLAMQESRNEGNFHNKIVDKDEAGWNEVTKKDRNKEIAMELNPFLNSFAKAVKKSISHQEKADKGKQSQSTSDKQILLDWIEFITGNKANYYKR